MRNAAFLVLLTSFAANAVIVRDGVPDLQYRMAVADFPRWPIFLVRAMVSSSHPGGW